MVFGLDTWTDTQTQDNLPTLEASMLTIIIPSITDMVNKFKFKFFINKESSIRNMHVWKNAQMTRTNKRIKQMILRKTEIRNG